MTSRLPWNLSTLALLSHALLACTGGMGGGTDAGPGVDGSPLDADRSEADATDAGAQDAADVDADSRDDGGEAPGDADAAHDAIDGAVVPVSGNLAGSHPELVIVSAAGLSEAWREYAAYREERGLRTEVWLVEELLADHEGGDDAERLRAALVEAHGLGTRFVLLGGDAELVPYRRIADRVTVLLVDTYRTNGPSQLYYSELGSDWDGDGDGLLGEDADISLAELREPELHVGRVPASVAAEVEIFAQKVELYESGLRGREAFPLIMTDVATSVPVLGSIDSARLVEPTIDGVFPEALADNARRLYATEAASAEFGAEVITPDLVVDAMNEGYSLALHSGHGTHGTLSHYIDTALVDSLTNDVPPVMLSCACNSGNFADFASSDDPDTWPLQGPDDDTAAERFLLGAGGGVAYVGSTATGLGPMGGVQMVHSTLEGLLVEGLPTIGEALAYGRAHMRSVAINVLGVPMPMTNDSERWTQLVTILLGDPSLRPWTGPATSLVIDAPGSFSPSPQELTVEVTSEADAAPIADALVVLRQGSSLLMRARTAADGRATFSFEPLADDDLVLTVTGRNLLPHRRTIPAEG